MDEAVVGIVLIHFGLLWWRTGRLEAKCKDILRRLDILNNK